MKKLLFLFILVCIEKALHAQYVYTIKADSVKITNSCDTAELIIENHTQNVPGFLFNKGKGRTEFRRPLQKISDTLYLVGADSLKMPNAWLQGGNAWGTTGILGTKDNNHVDFYTNSTWRGRWTNNGSLLIGTMADDGNKLQIGGVGGISFNANLSRSGDRILIGGFRNTGDGQNSLIRMSSDNGATYRDVLVERDGKIGLGVSNVPVQWWGLTPAIRIGEDGLVSFMTHTMYFGQPPGPNNSSALVTKMSSVSEMQQGTDYPNRQNTYYFGTELTGPIGSNVRAPLNISARELGFYSGTSEAEAARLTENRNLLIGTTTDNGFKLQVNGNVFANGDMHKIGKLAIVSGFNASGSGFATGIRIDDPVYGSFAFQGSAQGWAKDMFSFDDAYGGAGQDVLMDDQSIIRIRSGFKQNNVTGQTANVLNITPEYKLNLATSNPLVMRGIYYNPILTSIPSGSKHIAIETRTGDVLLGTISGNTGIGTNAPTAQFHTTGSVRFGGLTNDNSLARILVSDANGNVYYRDASSLAMNDVLNSDLAVNGSISAQKMKITQTGTWPDYVFSKHYHLPSLHEVEQFIQQNSHLPGIPSAADVETKGIDVGENQAALLKKIEELTLYMIQQQKELQDLRQELTELKNTRKSK